ncbi:MAG: VCBS repeat-containing protein [Desulfuromonadales bacterium]
MGRFRQLGIGLAMWGVMVLVMAAMGVSDAGAVTYYVTKKSDLIPQTQMSAQVSEVTSGRQVYLFGGSDMVSTNTNAISRYDIALNTWQTLPFTLPYAVWSSGPDNNALASNGKYYLSPGNGPGGWGQHSKIIEVDPVAGTAVEKASIIGSNIWEIALAPAPAAKGGVYLFGGWTGSGQTAIRHYNPTTDQITTVANLTAARSIGCRIVHPNGNVYLIGGNANGTYSVVEKFNLTSESVTSVSNPNAYLFGYPQGWVGSDNNIYIWNSTWTPLGTASGKLFKLDPTTETFTDLGIPTMSGNSTFQYSWKIVKDAATDTLLSFSRYDGTNWYGEVSSMTANVTECYQENATQPNSCGAVGGGTYSSTGAWNDGVWDNNYTTINQTGVYVTYKKPTNAIGGKLKAKLYSWPSTSTTQEANIPNQCWSNGDTVRLWIHQTFQDSRCGDYMAYGGQYCEYVDCYDGSSWNNAVVGSGSVNSSAHFNTIYEEGITWYLTASPSNGVCGTANGTVITTAPTDAASLCSSGTASVPTGTGPWSWTCQGSNGGTTASCSAQPTYSKIFLSSGGSLNGTSINSTSNTITVAPGTAISGTVKLSSENNYGANSVVPVIYQPTWGDRTTSYQTISSWVGNGTVPLAANISLTAPTTAGTYFIIFASSGEMDGGDIASMTNWGAGSNVWNDGNDLVDLTESQLSGSLANGYVTVPNYQFGDGKRAFAIGCSYIKVIVAPAPASITFYHQSDGTVVGKTTDGSSILGSAQFYQEANGTWSIVGQGDFDGDGVRDLVWWNNRTGQVYLMLMSNPTTIKSGAVIYTEPNTYWRIVATGDLNGDGKTDLIWWNQQTGQVKAMLLNGTTVTGSSIIYTEPNTDWKIVAAADFNGNGKAELLWWNSYTGQTAIGQTNGTSASTANLIWTEPNTTWRIAGAGDLDGDGKADIIWHNRKTGQVYGMQTNGSSVTNGAMMYTEPNTYWEIVSVGNYNGDSKADLLWWNQLTGQVYLMPMNGLSAASGGALLYTEPDTTWHIQGETEWRDNLYGRGFTTTTK